MRGRSRLFFLALTAGLAVVCGSGCEPHTKHAVLTFFFTGVPPLGEDGVAVDATNVAVAPAADTQKRKSSMVVPRTSFSHGPYASGACYLCHETSATGGFRGLGNRKDAAGSVARPGIVPGRLVAPLSELCTGCHETKSLQTARKAGLWVHSPVSAGPCITCHGPHSGAQKYFLAKAGGESCLECHRAGSNSSKGVHRETENCLDCHNAHFGKDRRLLTATYREPW